MSTARMSDHAIKLTIEFGGPVHAEFVCNAPDNAACQAYCDKPECEEGCIDVPGHRSNWKYSDQCLQLIWIEEGGTWDEQYCGPPSEARSAPINLVWNGDCYEWEYSGVTA